MTRIVDPDDTYCCVAEPTNPRSSVMMARHVIFPRKEEHVVLMLNARKETLYLPKGTVVGRVANSVTAEVMETAPKGYHSSQEHYRKRSVKVE